jgi:hypothetical protein
LTREQTSRKGTYPDEEIVKKFMEVEEKKGEAKSV